jgi:hypothetical protein
MTIAIVERRRALPTTVVQERCWIMKFEISVVARFSSADAVAGFHVSAADSREALDAAGQWVSEAELGTFAVLRPVGAVDVRIPLGVQFDVRVAGVRRCRTAAFASAPYGSGYGWDPPGDLVHKCR